MADTAFSTGLNSFISATGPGTHLCISPHPGQVIVVGSCIVQKRGDIKVAATFQCVSSVTGTPLMPPWLLPDNTPLILAGGGDYLCSAPAGEGVSTIITGLSTAFPISFKCTYELYTP